MARPNGLVIVDMGRQLCTPCLQPDPFWFTHSDLVDLGLWPCDSRPDPNRPRPPRVTDVVLMCRGRGYQAALAGRR